MSYYVVRVGRQPGVYTTWAQCQAQTQGFPRAVYKKFGSMTEAQQFLQVSPNGNLPSTNFPTPVPVAGTPEAVGISEKELAMLSFSHLLPGVVTREVVDIYTDGSEHQRLGYVYIGSGSYCQHQGREYYKSFACSPALLATYTIEPNTKVSNPTAELLAFSETLLNFYQQPLRPGILLRFWIDYSGVGHFMSGANQAKESYIAAIITSARAMLAGTNASVEIYHIRGHRNLAGNEASDRAAKDATDYDQFPQLVTELCRC
jgi:ribonuclease HI